jgi:hypothetical protein
MEELRRGREQQEQEAKELCLFFIEHVTVAGFVD